MTQDNSCLNSFIQRVADYYQIVSSSRIPATQYEIDFRDLKNLSQDLKQSDDIEYQSCAGMIAENRKKNRYKDIAPFDATRVKLTMTNNDPNSDYINASFIQGADNRKSYIASQGPLPHTVLDFWQMLWQYNVNVVVMVCREIELGKKKCERYWANRGETKTFGSITVTSESDDNLEEGYCLRVMKVVNGQETRYIKQFHYTSWPDHGVPKTCYEIITLINHVRDVQSYSEDVRTPLCIHCSAGCGRTGAAIVLDYVRNLLYHKRVPPNFKTFEIIAQMRRQRPAIVQTKEQYEFVNVAISELFRIYMRTQTLKYKEFSVGYQGEEYVNVSISKDKPRNGNSLPRTAQYENFEPRSNGVGAQILADAPEEPPPKPKRPLSTMFPPSSNLDITANSRKQSMPAVLGPPAKLNLRQRSAALAPVKSPPTEVMPAKPNPAAKPAPPAKAQGTIACPTSPMHDKTAPVLSSFNSTTVPLTHSKNDNGATKPETGRATAAREKPGARESEFFEVKSKSQAPIKSPESKHDSKLKIREEDDLTSESEADSPLSKANFDGLKPGPPPVKPKPRVTPKPQNPATTESTGETTVQDRKKLFEGKPVPRPLNPRPRPHDSPPHSDSKISGEKPEIKKKPPGVKPKVVSVFRSASVSNTDRFVLSRSNDAKWRGKNGTPGRTTPDNVKVVETKIGNAAAFYAARPRLVSDPYSPTDSLSRDVVDSNPAICASNPAYGLPVNSRDRSQPVESGFQNVNDAPQSYVNHVLPPVAIGNALDNMSYGDAPGMNPPQSVEPAHKDYVNDSVVSRSNRSDSHGSVGTACVEEVKRPVPTKPRRSIRRLPDRSSGEDSAPNSPVRQAKLQTYTKQHQYCDVTLPNTNDAAPGIQSGNNFQKYKKNNFYNEVDANGRRDLPPTVPIKTVESQIPLDDDAPPLPERTEDSYQFIQVSETDVQTYESFDSTTLPVTTPENADARRLSAPSPGPNNALKNLFDKATTSVFSKVGATISKTGDDTGGGTPISTVDDRKSSYTPEARVYNGQDMSFPRRLFKKVRGPRKQK